MTQDKGQSRGPRSATDVSRQSAGGVPLRKSDRDGDGVQDRIRADVDGDGKFDDRDYPVYEQFGRLLMDAGPAPGMELSLPEVIRTKSEYDISAVSGPINAALSRWRRYAFLSVPLMFAMGLYLGSMRPWIWPWSLDPPAPVLSYDVSRIDAAVIDAIRADSSWFDGLLPEDQKRLVEAALADQRDREGD